MRKISGVLLILAVIFCLPVFAVADSKVTTEQELLLFWDEKDLYVQTATRSEKPISQTAENMTVITAKEIEDMNAHTISEVLNRVTGVFVDFQGQDFGSAAQLHIQGSEDRHVLVMLDGIIWNTLSDGNAITQTIPVRIIDRIEIIKGPASSAWGSSLGGVINVITKSAGSNPVPNGTVSASYGEANSQDYGAEVYGKAGAVGYYLFGGYQRSDGLRDDRSFENRSFYSKIAIPLSEKTNLGFTFGYNEPRTGAGDIPSGDLTSKFITRDIFATASLNAVLMPELNFDASLHAYRHKFMQSNDVLGVGFYGPAGSPFLDLIFDEKTYGGSGKLIWTHGIQTAVLGFDISKGNLDQTLTAGPFLQSMGVPEISTANPDIFKQAVYLNDTITIERFSITPGIRYDHNDVSGSFMSPSLGATYKISEKTIVRVTGARGFTSPPLSFTSGGGLFLDPNPSLEPEKVWSVQGGIESNVGEYVWAKATAFYHDMKDAIFREPFAGGPPGCSGFSCNDLMVNLKEGGIKRKGFELEAETAPFYNFSLKAGFAYVRINPSDENSRVNYTYNLIVKYDDRKSFMAEFFGHYIWWDLDDSLAAKYNAFIWDLNLRKNIYSTEKINTEIFLTAHNIFNGSQYTFGDTKNPGRWFEGGIRLKF